VTADRQRVTGMNQSDDQTSSFKLAGDRWPDRVQLDAHLPTADASGLTEAESTVWGSFQF
jgi:hypothetical protein